MDKWNLLSNDNSIAMSIVHFSHNTDLFLFFLGSPYLCQTWVFAFSVFVSPFPICSFVWFMPVTVRSPREDILGVTFFLKCTWPRRQESSKVSHSYAIYGGGFVLASLSVTWWQNQEGYLDAPSLHDICQGLWICWLFQSLWPTFFVTDILG